MKKILFSLMTLVLVIGLVGAGAFAYFSDTEESTTNTFTAGTLDMEPLNMGPVVIDNMKPGDQSEIVLKLKNIGTIDIKYLVMRDEPGSYTVTDPGSDGSDLGNVIEILSIKEYLDGGLIEDLPGATYESWLVAKGVSNNDGHLSLREFLIGFPPGTPGGNDYWDVVTLSDNWGAGELEVGHTYKMVLSLQFMEAGVPQNEYQEDSLSFNLEVMGTHVDKTEIDGYVSP